MSNRVYVEVSSIEMTPDEKRARNKTGYALKIHRGHYLGGLSDAALERLTSEVLVDDICEQVQRMGQRPKTPACFIDVRYKAGVTDTRREALFEAAKILNLPGLSEVSLVDRYVFEAPLEQSQLLHAARLLSNGVVQNFYINEAAPAFEQENHAFVARCEEIEILSLDDDALCALSEARRLALDLEEMQALKRYFGQEGRNPTDVEIETMAQTWSEHCVHKTFRAKIDTKVFDSTNAEISNHIISSMLDTYLVAATQKVAKDHVRSAFVDNAGIVAFDDEFDLAIKVETHNHPSALEPFGGAHTGVGGCVRDILGVSAKPIANTAVLCFGDPNFLPATTNVAPAQVREGVLLGIEDYGNKMGIPTTSGALLFDAGYNHNPLVFCGSVGILPKGSHPTKAMQGDHIVVIGGRTGRDGLKGATFSSMTMTHDTAQTAGSVVQIGHPINEKQLQEVIVRARDQKLYNAITDCGAGGLSSAVGEMGRDLGARVFLERVPLKYKALHPWEIWLSEAQERMVLAVSSKHLARLQSLCDAHEVELSSIGTFDGSKQMHITHEGKRVCCLDMAFMYEAHPQKHLSARHGLKEMRATSFEVKNRGDTLLHLLAHQNASSREEIVRRFDHEVQGGSVVKPFAAATGDSPNDATLIVPLEARLRGRHRRGFALGCGINIEYGKHDPYRMASACVDEAIRNVTCVGANPDKISLVDNFCWGDPKQEDRLGALVECARACHDAALLFGAPFVSGKDSLNNEYENQEGERRAIPHTILVTALGIVDDVSHASSSALKEAGNHVLLIGTTQNEMGGSLLSVLDKSLGLENTLVPTLQKSALSNARAVHTLLKKGLAKSCHDLSEGGLLVALAEMALGGRLGLNLDVSRALDSLSAQEKMCKDAFYFSESLSRYLVEVRPENLATAIKNVGQIPCFDLGQVTQNDRIVISSNDACDLDVSVSDCLAAFKTAF